MAMIFQVITRTILSGGLFAISNGSNFLLVDDRRMDRHQYSTDERKANKTETDHGESTETKQSYVVLLFLFQISAIYPIPTNVMIYDSKQNYYIYK